VKWSEQKTEKGESLQLSTTDVTGRERIHPICAFNTSKIHDFILMLCRVHFSVRIDSQPHH